jgi:hypothetical protein
MVEIIALRTRVVVNPGPQLIELVKKRPSCGEGVPNACISLSVRKHRRVLVELTFSVPSE